MTRTPPQIFPYPVTPVQRSAALINQGINAAQRMIYEMFVFEVMIATSGRVPRAYVDIPKYVHLPERSSPISWRSGSFVRLAADLCSI